MGNKVVKLSLTSQELYNHVFKKALNGYDSFEVDLFLDKVIADYLKVEQNLLIKQQEYDDLIKKIDDIKQENESLKVDNASMKSKLGNISNTKNVSIENIDLLKKIDKLERALYVRGIDPNKVK